VLPNLFCPVCTEPNLEVVTFDRPILVEMLDDGSAKYTTATFYCPTCSHDGMITYIQRVGNGQEPRP
jgi:hypothetical protein